MKKSLKLALSQHQLTLGTWITIPSPIVAEIMCQSAFDWLAVDLEHTAISIDQAQDLIRVIDQANKTPLVRLTSNDVNLIKRVMDAGSHGIIVPQVNSKAEAEAAVAAVYYPPRGIRGVGLARAQQYGAGFQDYQHWLANHAVVIVQIENILAVNRIEEILKVPGIDGYIVGPYDLSASMGMPGNFTHPDVVAAIKHVTAAAEKINLPGGIHVIEPEPAKLKAAIEANGKFIAYSLDFRMLDVACRVINEVKHDNNCNYSSAHGVESSTGEAIKIN